MRIKASQIGIGTWNAAIIVRTTRLDIIGGISLGISAGIKEAKPGSDSFYEFGCRGFIYFGWY